MSSTWGNAIKLSIFGGSHTEAIGVTVDGLPAGEQIDWEEILIQMARRAPGQDPTATARSEKDMPKVLCGLLNGVTTGAPLTAIIENTNQRSKDYENLRVLPRPGHADYTAYLRYGNHHDVRGGGHFSGRLTAPLVFAGALARQILSRRGVTVGSHVVTVGQSQGDEPFEPVHVSPELLNRLNREYFPVIEENAREEMRREIENVRLEADSVGGIVECAVTGMPAGVGNPMFGGVENLISSLVFGIPAVKGIDFGAGFSAAYLRGSQNNDTFYYDEQGNVKTRTNFSGGILGGITSGMPLIFQVAIKPTPSIGKEQDTIHLEKKENAKLVIEGRHDPCIVPRAAPVVEAAACIACLELLAENGSV
ncbi:MAG: chorismate synthase [Acutalibacter sp.]|nr:chorismate synthase [Acutalibacter sp.]